ncbi:MAG: hypothetical protein JRF63_00765 [Deltaproteobacteria bacterium]|nr:hypothetical protein [Deltaproteobacteria bacterium]
MHSHSNSSLSAVLLALVISIAAGELRAEGAERPPVTCDGRACIVIEYEPALRGEAGALVEALGLRLAKHDVRVELGSTDDDQEEPEKANSGPRPDQEQVFLWVVHLRELSSELVLLAVDNFSTEGEDDLVRELRRGATTEATAWTLALMIEETVLPYIEGSGGKAPLGAGLAIIEPPVVGGTKKDDETGTRSGPTLRFVSLALAVYRLSQADDFIAGPRASIEVGLAGNVVASLGIGWVGWAEFSAHGIGGSTALLPVDVMFGYVFMPEQVVELTASAGFSVGFSIFRASRESRHITEVLFDPLGQVSVRAVFRVFGPLALFVDGGAAFVFVQDVLRDSSNTIYRQDWVMPFFDIGVQFWFV